MQCVPIISLDSLKLEIRTNPAGVLPLFDYTLGFNQIIIETCCDSRVAVIEYFSSLFPVPAENEALRKSTLPDAPSKMVNTFGKLISYLN